MNGIVATVAVTFAIQVAVSAAGIAGPVLAPFAGAQLSLNAALIGIYVAFMYATAAIVTATSGAWLQRFGPMGTSQLCLMFAGLSLLAISTGTLWGFALGGFLAGIGYGPTTPASSVVLSRVGANRFRNLIFSIKQTGVPGGNMAAAAISAHACVDDRLASRGLDLGRRRAGAGGGADALAPGARRRRASRARCVAARGVDRSDADDLRHTQAAQFRNAVDGLFGPARRVVDDDDRVPDRGGEARRGRRGIDSGGRARGGRGGRVCGASSPTAPAARR